MVDTAGASGSERKVRSQQTPPIGLHEMYNNSQIQVRVFKGRKIFDNSYCFKILCIVL